MSTDDRSPCENRETLELVDDALQDLWAVANRLAKIRPPGDHFQVTIFGSSRVQPGEQEYDDVRRLAERLAGRGCDIVTGGGPGLMEAANKGAQLGDPEDRSHSVGIRVALPFEQGANPFVERLYTHRTFFSRLHHFVRNSSAYVVMPGGVGTTLELVMVWQLLQVGHIGGVSLIAVGEMWRDLADWARRHMTAGDTAFADPEDVSILYCVDTVDEAADIIEAELDRRAES